MYEYDIYKRSDVRVTKTILCDTRYAVVYLCE